jgi:hypothetical protein
LEIDMRIPAHFAILGLLTALACSSSSGPSGSGPGGDAGPGTDSSGPKHDGSSPPQRTTTLANGTLDINYIAVDDTNVYFSEEPPGTANTFWKFPIAGGSAVKLATAVSSASILNLKGLVVVDGTLVWAEADAMVIEGVPVGGGSRKTIASVSEVDGLTSSGSDVYWADSNSFYRVPVTGGTPETISVDGGTGDPFVTDGSSIYFVSGDNEDIVSVPVSGGTPTTLVTGSGTTVDQIVVSSGTLFWSLEGGEVMSAPVSGGTGKQVLDQPNGGLGAYIAVDTSAVYVTGDGLGCAPSSYGIWTAPRGGGKGTQLVTGLFGNAIAADATNLYTFTGTCVGGGYNVVKIAKM